MTGFPNWFAGQQHNFEEHLAQFKGKSNLQFMQVGAFAGHASKWLLDNVLTDPSSILIDIDTWLGSDEKEHKAMNFSDVYEDYISRTSGYENCYAMRGDSRELMHTYEPDTFDFIYIDGDHNASAVLKDAEDAHKLIKNGGIIAFDDYLWHPETPLETRPQPAIDEFLLKYANKYKILTHSYQVWIQKNDN